jgi:hypothetical protein
VADLAEIGLPASAAATIVAHFQGRASEAEAQQAAEQRLQPDQLELELQLAELELEPVLEPALSESAVGPEKEGQDEEDLNAGMKEEEALQVTFALSHLLSQPELEPEPELNEPELEVPSAAMVEFDEAAVLAWVGSVPGLTVAQSAAVAAMMAEEEYEGAELAAVTARMLRRRLKVIMAVVMVWTRMVIYHSYESLYKTYFSRS